MRAILSTRVARDSNGCSVYYGTTNSLEQLGTIFGSGTETIASGRTQCHPNRAIWYRNKLYVLHDGAVWVFNENTNSWAVSFQVPDYIRANTEGAGTGLYYFIDGINNTGKIGFFIYSSVNGLRQYYFDGYTWVGRDKYQKDIYFPGPQGMYSETYLNNKVYMSIDNLGVPGISLDFIGGGAASITEYWNGSVWSTSRYDFTHFNAKHRVYIFSHNNSNPYMMALGLIIGGRKSHIYRMDYGNSFPYDGDFFSHGFSDGSGLYTFALTSLGNQLIKYDFGINDVEATVPGTGFITSNIAPADTFPTSDPVKWRNFWDFHENVENPSLYIAHSRYETETPIKFHKWNGPYQKMEYKGQSHNGFNGLPDNYVMGGERTYVPNRVNIQIENYGPGNELSTCKLYFRIYNSNTIPSDTQCMAFFIVPSGNTNDIPRMIATLKRPSHGSLTNSKYITGLTMDSGILYSVELDGDAHNFKHGDALYVIPVVSGV